MNASLQKPTRREELGIESRRKIIDAAGSLMAERGFAGTSISAVKKKSGLPTGSIYWHFENKEALLTAVIEDATQRWYDAMPSPENLPNDPAELVDELVRAASRTLEEHPEILRLILVISLERREVDPGSLEVIRRARAFGREKIREVMRVLLAPIGESDPNGSPRGEEWLDQFANFTLAYADGVFIAKHLDPEDTDLTAAFDLLRRALSALARETFG